MENKIKNQQEYDEVAARIEVLKDAEADSKEEKELQELTRQIIEFESKRSVK